MLLRAAVLCVSGCSVLNGNSNSGNGSGSAGNPSPPPPATLSNSVNHIVFLAQENRSFDHYFGALREYWAKNGYPDQSFDGLPQFDPASGASPLNAPAPKNPGCDPTVPAPADCVFDASNPVTSFHLVTQCAENPSLTKRDAIQMDMTEFFDFSNPPWKTPPQPPTQLTSGACYTNQLP